MTVLVIVGTVAIIAVAVAAGVIVDRKFGILPRAAELEAQPKPRGPRYAAGEAPSTAIRARGGQLDKLRSSRRCSQCRQTLVASGDDERVRYGTGELLVLHLRCTQCGETRSLYVDAT